MIVSRCLIQVCAIIERDGEHMALAIEEAIDSKISGVRTEALDLSFGEIVNLYSSEELIIQPEYQRLFRWSNDQRSRLIESILLELPIPQIFVIENSNGVIELIDGLQRVSSVIQFIEPAALGLDALRLSGCDLIQELNGKVFGDLSLKLRLRLKRSSVRTIVIKRQNESTLRYEMFKRLNTGGANLSPQEIRNCTSRMLGSDGAQFYSFLQTCAASADFRTCTTPLPESAREEKGDEELVLRFFALKNGRDIYRGSVRDWLDTYMEGVLLGQRIFDYSTEKSTFTDLFAELNRTLSEGAFVRYRGSEPAGALAPAYFEAVTMASLKQINRVRGMSPEEAKQRIARVVQSPSFRENTGPGANSKEKLERRIALVEEALLAAQ